MRSQQRGSGVSRALVLEYVPRRDAAQRLSLAYCLVVRQLGSQPVPGPEGKPGQGAALPPASTSPRIEVTP
jgi:hypothetical protein